MNCLYRLTRLFLFSTVLGASWQVQADNLPDYSAIVEEVLPSVVTITTRSAVDSVQQVSSQDFSDIPGDFLPYIMAANNQNAGSGFVFSSDGYVLTNAHVVENANSISIQLHDGRLYDAEVIGIDAGSDIALLKIPARDLVPAQLADNTRSLKVGQTVLGIGSPYSFEYSVTSGIISYLGRRLRNGAQEEETAAYIQTDMLINPGNSGGPIVNGEGDVIGMSSRIFSTTGASIGISFGIPVNVIDQMVERFLTGRDAQSFIIGVETSNINPDQVRIFGLQKALGALVTRVDSGSPAALSGLMVNDVIVTLDNKIIRNSEELDYQLALLESGHEVRVTAIRNGRYFATQFIGSLEAAP
ncbi:MAG: serine peptidase [Gammaproteobacteria bacterium]|nr:serine peptidase [Gammaproteobacteria bacterium]MAY03146.1 serine peptidase [Gammaproteobacteria bacterium]|tara:strand:- start:448 stop:1518 length:1071 start_codon:yes stop_codon:yes gene_type:complete